MLIVKMSQVLEELILNLGCSAVRAASRLAGLSSCCWEDPSQILVLTTAL